MRGIELHSTALLSRWKPVMWEKKQLKSWFVCFNSLQRSFPDANVRPPRARRRRLLLFSPESGSLQQLSASSSPAAAAPVRLLNLGIAVWLPRGRKAGKKEKKKRKLRCAAAGGGAGAPPTGQDAHYPQTNKQTKTEMFVCYVIEGWGGNWFY